MPEIVPIKIKRLSKEFNDIPLPSYSTKGSSGLDIRAAVADQVFIPAGELRLIPTNLSVEIPEGYEIQVRPRSGLAAKHGIAVLNSPGTIDADYRGEIGVILINLSNEEFTVENGERICQMVIAAHETVKWELVESLEETKRGAGGFGHTGKH